MNDQELDRLLEENLKQAFELFEQVSDEDCIKDNGDTDRILKLIQKNKN